MDGVQLRDLRLRLGLTQQEVAAAAGMRQPDLSAIERGRRGTAEGRRRVLDAIRSLARPSRVLDPAGRAVILDVAHRYGGSDVRIFGSVARQQDSAGSDLDLMITFPEDFDLFDLMNVEHDLESALGIPVDVVADSPSVREALASARLESVPL